MSRRIDSANAKADAEDDGDDEYATDDAGQAGMFAAEGYEWARRLLGTHWSHVERVASALAVDNFLTSHEVRALLEGVEFGYAAMNRFEVPDLDFLSEWCDIWIANRNAHEAHSSGALIPDYR